MQIWLLSPYHTGSHQSWAEGYIRHSCHSITLLKMAGRFWKWRMQGAAIELAAQASQLLAAGRSPDLVLATDMLHLPAWLGLLHGQLPGRLPIVLYMHENQLTYPWRPAEKRDLTYAMFNWLSQLAADAVLFNSAFHRKVWFDALPNLLKHFPDYNHLAQIERVQARSQVCPVGVELQALAQQTRHKTTAAQPPLILWNQRWEHDKRPDRFFELLYQLRERNLAFRLAVAGENFRQVAVEFETARLRLHDTIVQWGYLPSRAAYLQLLQEADLVISTADHEFFGISVLEAVAAGAFPLLPARLSYPELIPPTFQAGCLYQDEADLLAKASAWLTTPHPAPGWLRTSLAQRFDWQEVAARYDALFTQLLCKS
ncbi:MAG: DUF3524 domain-containing protein [Chloroflexi bacterium]|nr:DUF3524 domain-containing protein [Chloroflexota bacterium]